MAQQYLKRMESARVALNRARSDLIEHCTRGIKELMEVGYPRDVMLGEIEYRLASSMPGRTWKYWLHEGRLCIDTGLVGDPREISYRVVREVTPDVLIEMQLQQLPFEQYNEDTLKRVAQNIEEGLKQSKPVPQQ
ncbi:MAG: hypothetical protein HY361_03890 [Candidatus Aenigmarchaeota archaeon]|nr:hypothetical protein [Candidatus Aenigmarchaeota archaeon]